MRGIFVFYLVSLLINLNYLYSNNDKVKEPCWVFLKRAENLKEKGDYSTAIIEARKARLRFIEEKLENYFEKIKQLYRNKTNHELRKMLKAKDLELKQDDRYPEYHELLGDLYILTDFLEEAEKEYKIALQQKDYFECQDEILEIKYKLADVYHKNNQYDLEDITYREIVKGYFVQKNNDYWNRMKYNIRKDQTLNHVFRVYRTDGIKYLQALYRIGRRCALLKKKSESLFYLVNAAVVWMTFNNYLIKKQYYNFQYIEPVDFINYVTNKIFFEYMSKDYIMNEIMFYIGYNFYLTNDKIIMNQFFELAIKYSTDTEKEEEIIDRIDYLLKHRGHVITYEEIID